MFELGQRGSIYTTEIGKLHIRAFAFALGKRAMKVLPTFGRTGRIMRNNGVASLPLAGFEGLPQTPTCSRLICQVVPPPTRAILPAWVTSQDQTAEARALLKSRSLCPARIPLVVQALPPALPANTAASTLFTPGGNCHLEAQAWLARTQEGHSPCQGGQSLSLKFSYSPDSWLWEGATGTLGKRKK